MRGFIPWAAIVVLAFLLWDARKALGRGGQGIRRWSLARLLALWAAYALVVWSTSNAQGGKRCAAPALGALVASVRLCDVAVVSLGLRLMPA